MPQRSSTTGRRIMNELMGDGYVEKKDGNRNSFNDVIQDYSREVCFGRVWARDGIDRKTRSIVNLAMLTALGRPAQLAHHVEGAISNGCTVAEDRGGPAEDGLLHSPFPVAAVRLQGRRGSPAGLWSSGTERPLPRRGHKGDRPHLTRRQAALASGGFR